MTGEHRAVRESLGAWVLGSLDGAERRAVEDHLARCDECAAEVSALSAMPGLLNRLTEEEVSAGLLVPSAGLRDRLLADVEATELTLRRRLHRWRVAAAAAAATAVAAAVVAVLGVTGVLGPAPTAGPTFDRIVAPVAPAATEAADTTGEAAALAWEWGTTVELEVSDLPVRDAYVLWAVADDGTRQQAGTWGSTASRDAVVRGACSIQRDELARVEVTDTAGDLLLTFDF